MHFIELVFEAQIIIVDIGEDKQLVEIRSPEVIQMLLPAFNNRLNCPAACPSRRDKNVLLIAIMFQPSSVNGYLSAIFQIKKPTGQVGSWFDALLIRSI
jgi:hypothetical protein